MIYRVIITPMARRTIKHLSATVKLLVIRRLRLLENDPRPRDSRKIKGEAKTYRIRLGDYRIIYRFEDKELLIMVIKVAHRREAYRQIGHG